MAFELIPYPLSLIFVVIFGLVVEVVLWKLRRNGKTYRLISDLALVALMIVIVLAAILAVSSLQ